MSNVNWREVSDNLIRAMDSGSDDLQRSATLSYRLACELDSMKDGAVPPDDGEWKMQEVWPLSTGNIITRTPTETFNGLTAEPRMGDRVRTLSGVGWNISGVLVDNSCENRYGIALAHDMTAAGYYYRHEFEILPRISEVVS